MVSMGTEDETHANQSTSVLTTLTTKAFPKMPGTEVLVEAAGKMGTELQG